MAPGLSMTEVAPWRARSKARHIWWLRAVPTGPAPPFDHRISVVMRMIVPAVATVMAMAPIADVFQFPAGVMGLAAAIAIPLDHTVQVPLRVVDAFAAVFPALGLSRNDRRDPRRGQECGKTNDADYGADFHGSPPSFVRPDWNITASTMKQQCCPDFPGPLVGSAPARSGTFSAKRPFQPFFCPALGA